MKLNQLIEQLAYRYYPQVDVLLPHLDHPCDRNLFFKHRNVLDRRYDARAVSIRKSAETEMHNWLKALGYKVSVRDEFTVTKIDDEIMLLVIDCVGVNDEPTPPAMIQHLLKVTATVSKNGQPLQKCLHIEFSRETFQMISNIVEYDGSVLTEMQAKFDDIETMTEPPEGNKDYCNGCEFIDQCNQNALANVNCRTCASYELDTRSCDNGKSVCDKHVYHPEYIKLIGFDVVDADPVTMTIDYGKFSNGKNGSMTSEMMQKAYGVKFLQNETVQEILDVFDGKLENVKRLSE